MPTTTKRNESEKTKFRRICRQLLAQGFDNSSVVEDGVRARCSQCEALVINGLATHERGCPNQRG
jgi:hypothetical protein